MSTNTEQLPPLLATAVHQSNALAQYMQQTSQMALMSNMGRQELEDLMIHYGTLHGGLCAQIYAGSMAKYQVEQLNDLKEILRQNNALLTELIACFQSSTKEEEGADDVR